MAKAQLTAVIRTNKSSYVLGERIEAAITALNDSDDDITLRFPSTFQSQYLLNDAPLDTCCGFGIFSEATIPGRGTFDWDFGFSERLIELGVGTHQITGYIARRIDTTDPLGGLSFFTLPNYFEITEPDPVVDDVFIDFETYPDGTSTRGPSDLRGIWQNAYAAWGVRLSTTGGSDPTTGFNLDDNFSADNTILHTFLSQRNIKADFDMPVFEVSATVGSAQGRSVTMTIFDDEGNVLDSITSDVVSDYPALVDPVKLQSDVPIASVEWMSSDPSSSVRIDDLFLDVRVVPEPSGAVLVTMLLMLTFHRDRSFRSFLGSQAELGNRSTLT